MHPRLVQAGDLEVEIGLVGAGGFALFFKEVGQHFAVVGIRKCFGQGGVDEVLHGQEFRK